jgi:hypothetical protein
VHSTIIKCAAWAGGFDEHCQQHAKLTSELKWGKRHDDTLHVEMQVELCPNFLFGESTIS